MPDSFTETTTISWGSKIRQSFSSVLIGTVLFLAAFPTLFLNEGCYVKDMKALAQGESSVVTVSPGQVDPANEGRLVHMIGDAQTGEEVSDPDFDLARNAIKLERSVEMYQWQERQETKEVKKVGGSTEQETTYTYDETWSASLIDSSAFKLPENHENPDHMRFQSEEWVANEVHVGAFKLTDNLTDAINAYTELKVGDEELDQLPDDLYNETILSNGEFYVGEDPASPQIGDLRVSYRIVAQPQTVSLYSGQSGDSFAPYMAKNGRALEQLQVGSLSSQQMFAEARQQSKIRTWLVRFGGFLAMAIGLGLVFGPLVAMADVLPFLGNLIEKGVSLFAGVIAFGLSFITISVAWIFYRPLVGIPLLLVGVGSMVGFILLKKKTGKTAQ